MKPLQLQKNACLKFFNFSSLITRPRLLLTLVAAVTAFSVLSACVTVNVNFPESAVQKATDDYVRDLYRAKEKGKTPAGGQPDPQKNSELRILPARIFPSIELFPSAWADPVIRIDSAKAKQVQDSLRGRLNEVLQFKRQGVLGESADGMLVMRNSSTLKPLLLKKVEKLMNDENTDRNALYTEVLASNGLDNSHLKRVQRNFARSFQAESPSGTWVESDGSWTQKP